MVVMKFSTRHEKGKLAPHGLDAETAETAKAAAGDMDVAEALEASAESAAGADLRPRPEGWETWSRNRKRKWTERENRNQRK